jgi:sortase (surface protein transpeptidase)
MTWGSRRFAAGAAVLALFLGGSCAGGSGPPERPAGAARPATSQTAQDPPADGAAAVGAFSSVRGYRPTPVPIRVTVPKIRVTSSLERLGKDSHGSVVAPHQWAVAGWYALGPRPGEPGAAVILGHVDSKESGPAVFFRLRELRPGDLVVVTRQGGSTVRFVVDRTEQYLKQQFPTEAVYFPTLTPTLRLVTCGGEFDRAAGHYRSNFIVFARLAP